MATHKVDVQTQADDEAGNPVGVYRYRWRCSCGRIGPWKSGASGSGGGPAPRRARNGGARHVAAMERG